MKLLYARDVRDLSVKGTITFKSGSQTNIGVADILSYSSSAQIGSDGLPLGATEAASFSLELDNTGRKYAPVNFDSAEVHMYCGIRVDPRNLILNSAFLFDRRDWENVGSPSRRSIVEIDDRLWMHVKGSSLSSYEGVRQYANDAKPMRIEGGTTYTFSALAMGGSGQQEMSAVIYWRDATGTVTQSSHSWLVGITPRRVSFSATAPNGCDRFDLLVGVDNDTTAQDVYFTDLIFEEGSTDSEDWVAAPEDYDASYADGFAWSDFGVWYVDSASAPEQSVSVSLNGYDALATHFEKKIADAPTAYPTTVGNLFMTMATAAGIRPKDPEFTNANFLIESAPEWNEDATIRDVLSYCAICAGGFARVARNGQLEIVSFSDGQTYDIGPELYHSFTLTGGDPYKFNAIEAMMDSESDEYTRFALNSGTAANATNTIQLDYNPLLSSQLVSLVVSDMAGIAMDAGELRWGGDPYVTCGDYMRVKMLDGKVYKIMVTSQSFSFDGGLGVTESCTLPSANSVASSSYSTSANAFDQNGNLRPSRVAGLDGYVLAATEAHFKHLTAETAEFDSLLASFIEAINLTVGKLSANVINVDEFTANVTQITEAFINEAHIDVAQVDGLQAVVAQIADAQISIADIDYAHIKDLIAGQAIITDGVGESLYIERLYVTSANILGATLGKLVLRGTDGGYYEVVIASDGTISTQRVSVTSGEISAGQTSDGRQIVATDANLRSLNAQSLRASSAIIARIFTSALTAGKITASEAFLASATIPTLYTTSVQAIGNSLDLSANTSVRLMVNSAVGSFQSQLNSTQSNLNSLESNFAEQVQRINSDIEGLRNQVDGQIETWFFDYTPMLSNEPAVSWQTEADKEKHQGDLFFDKSTGHSYRFFKQPDGSWEWQLVTDSDVAEALKQASEAKDTADSKRRVFLDTPYPPYDEGDLWVQGPTGDIMRCIKPRAKGDSYSISGDWDYASKYTDDTVANSALTQANSNRTEINVIKGQIELFVSKDDVKSLVDTVVVEYYLSESELEPIGGYWNEKAPPWEAGKYMWQRTVAVKQDGTRVPSQPTCISGAAGASPTAFTPQYYLSDSDTELTGGEIVEVPPEWSTGKFMWTRTKVEYDDGRDPTYTRWVLDRSFNDMIDKVVKNSAQLQVLKDEIKATVKRDEFDAMGDRLSTAESNIIQNAGQILSKVTREDAFGIAQSVIDQNADSIRLKAGKISWESDHSSMSDDGVFTSTNTVYHDNWMQIRNGEIFGGQGTPGTQQWSEIDLSGTSGGKEGLILNGKEMICLQTPTLYTIDSAGYAVPGFTGDQRIIYKYEHAGTTNTLYYTTMHFVNGICTGIDEPRS